MKKILKKALSVVVTGIGYVVTPIISAIWNHNEKKNLGK